MVKSYSKRTGSAHLIIVTVIVLVILGALGFVFWNNFINKKPSTTASQVSGSAQKNQPAVQELKIDDWSVKLTVPTGIAVSDIYYYKTHIGEGPDYYGFTTNRVRAEGGYCDNQVTGNLLTLTRLTSKTGAGTLINEAPVNGYYFYSDTSNGGITPVPECLKTDAANSDRALLNQMIKSLMTTGEKVISIRELGISITVPDSIKDLTYTYSADGTPTRAGGSSIVVGSVSFSTSSLTSRYPECSSDKANPLGSLTKITGVYGDGVLGPTWSGGGLTKQFSDSFLTFVGPQSACYFSGVGNDTTLGTSISSQMNDLSASIKAAKEL